MGAPRFDDNRLTLSAGHASIALATAIAGRGGRAEADGLFTKGLAAMCRDLGLQHQYLIAPTTAYARFALDDGGKPALARMLVRDAGRIVIERTARAAIDRRAERGLQQNRPTLLLAVRVAWQLASGGGRPR